MVFCLEQGADLHTPQLMPLPLTVSCFSKIQIHVTFLVLAHPGSPGKGPLNTCAHVCVIGLLPLTLCLCFYWLMRWWSWVVRTINCRQHVGPLQWTRWSDWFHGAGRSWQGWYPLRYQHFFSCSHWNHLSIHDRYCCCSVFLYMRPETWNNPQISSNRSRVSYKSQGSKSFIQIVAEGFY